jgi:hypothetical protein
MKRPVCWRFLWFVPMAGMLACGDATPTSPPTNPPTGGTASGVFPGFDASIYPGDAAMRAWLHPSSPYYWSGYYLVAPCHRDGSWTGKRATLATMGWGLTAIYVGQQDWTQIPAAQANRAVDPESPSQSLAVSCSASLLSASQGLTEAADAIDKMRADGFPDQSVVFLDVEFVTVVTPALLDYYRAWIGGVLQDGHYQPGIYAAKSNATALYDAAVAAYRAAGRGGAPSFWIAASTGFSLGAKPTAVGLDFAQLWQGMFDVTQTWNGASIQIDVDVASMKSPSAPTP